ncbi:MAG: hypothetical protein ACLP5E_21665 [Streptosporangiaceae bacterium]
MVPNRVAPAGVQIVETHLTRLSYAPEIAQTMLRQQQASAVIGARARIVEGAVGMVQMALQRLEEEGVVQPWPAGRCGISAGPAAAETIGGRAASASRGRRAGRQGLPLIIRYGIQHAVTSLSRCPPSRATQSTLTAGVNGSGPCRAAESRRPQ